MCLRRLDGTLESERMHFAVSSNVESARGGHDRHKGDATLHGLATTIEDSLAGGGVDPVRKIVAPSW